MSMIAAVQMNSTDDLDQNLTAVSNLIGQAATEKARLVVLPEMFAYIGKQTKDYLKIAESYGEGKIQDKIRMLAKQFNLWIVAGTIPIKTEEKNKITSSSFVYDEQGEIIQCYNKIHLFDVVVTPGQEEYIESQFIKPGIDPVVFDSPIGRIGLAVCYDIRFPELFRFMLNQGTDIFIIPAAFTKKTGQAHWSTLIRARAIENLSYVITSCQYGQHANTHETYGHSMIINPWGDILNKIIYETGVITSEIDLEYLKEKRKQMPIEKHQKIMSI